MGKEVVVVYLKVVALLPVYTLIGSPSQAIFDFRK
jgi:hypothetical protein